MQLFDGTIIATLSKRHEEQERFGVRVYWDRIVIRDPEHNVAFTLDGPYSIPRAFATTARKRDDLEGFIGAYIESWQAGHDQDMSSETKRLCRHIRDKRPGLL